MEYKREKWVRCRDDEDAEATMDRLDRQGWDYETEQEIDVEENGVRYRFNLKFTRQESTDTL